MRSQRLAKIEEYIHKHKSVKMDELCEVFGMSKNTIRRDINEIVEKGNIKKIYGGVSVQENGGLVPFNERNVKNSLAKERIAAKAAELVEDGDIIFIDSGTTTRHMINYIKDRKDLTIITNNLEVVVNAMPFENIEIISLTGTLNRKTFSFTGQHTSDTLKRYNINKAFMATAGISIKNGVTNSASNEYPIKNIAVKRSQEVYLLADHNKFNESSLMTYCELDEIDILVSDEEPEDELKDYLTGKDKKIIIANKSKK